MIVVGGTYVEECDWPEWRRLMGPGVRAALAVSELSPETELYTYVHKEAVDDIRSTMLASGLKAPQLRLRPDPVSYYYKHPLSSPPVRTPRGPEVSCPSETALEAAGGPTAEPWAIDGSTVLAFRLQESPILVSAERAVFELSQQDEEIGRKAVEKLALIAAENDFPEAIDNIRDFAVQTMTAHNADVLIFRRQSGGGLLFDGESQHPFPAYVADEWFKIGAGNVFCAMFAHCWGERKMGPLEAADIASRSSAYYASARALPIPPPEGLPHLATFDPAAKRKIFVTSPCVSMAQQWLLDEALHSFAMLGVDTVSPYDLGLDGVPRETVDVGKALEGCSAVLALAEGADLPSVLAVGLGRVRELPIVVLAEEPRENRINLWQGTDCEIARDLATAVYRAMVAGRRRPTA